MGRMTKERRPLHTLPELPYVLDALDPRISAETLN